VVRRIQSAANNTRADQKALALSAILIVTNPEKIGLCLQSNGFEPGWKLGRVETLEFLMNDRFMDHQALEAFISQIDGL